MIERVGAFNVNGLNAKRIHALELVVASRLALELRGLLPRKQPFENLGFAKVGKGLVKLLNNAREELAGIVVLLDVQQIVKDAK